MTQKGGKMLAITENFKTFVNELDSAINLCIDISEILVDCRREDLTERVGIFARKMPDYKILVQEREEILELIRKTCTEEYSMFDAHLLFASTRAELESTRRLIKL